MLNLLFQMRSYLESMPDLVGISDIAKLIGVSCQYLQIGTRCSIIFHNSRIAEIFQFGTYTVSRNGTKNPFIKRVNKSIKDIAYANMHINIAKEWLKLY